MANWFGGFGKKRLEEAQPSTTEKVANFLTNLYYRWGSNATLHQNSRIERYVLGKSTTAEECKQEMQRVVWFTYRSDVDNMADRTSDTGWGCMIRVGQMQLAQMLRTYKRLTRGSQGNKGDWDIIHAFHDNDSHSAYGWKNILSGPLAVKYNAGQGKWLCPSQIAYILSELHQQRPLKGYQGLQVIVQESALYFEELAWAMGFKICKHNEVRCSDCKNTRNIEFRHVAVFVIGCLSQTRKCLTEIMKAEQFVGMIGGRPKRAHFFTGFQQDLDRNNSTQLFYLDPHVVISNREVRADSYRCEDCRSISLEEIDPSVGICFYLRNPDDIVRLQDTLYASQEFTSSLPFGVGLHRKQIKVRSLDETAEVTKLHLPPSDISFEQLNATFSQQQPEVSFSSFHRIE